MCLVIQWIFRQGSPRSRWWRESGFEEDWVNGIHEGGTDACAEIENTVYHFRTRVDFYFLPAAQCLSPLAADSLYHDAELSFYYSVCAFFFPHSYFRRKFSRNHRPILNNIEFAFELIYNFNSAALSREPTSHSSHINAACWSIGVTNASKAITLPYTNLVTSFCHIPAMQLKTCRGNDAETRNNLLIIKHNSTIVL